MIKRTLYFGSEAYLSTQKEQLLIRFPDKTKPQEQVPIEDIGVLIVDHYRLAFTQSLMTKLLENNVAFITCNTRHHPTGMMLNLDGNTVQTERFAAQLNASVPLKKNLWQQTVKAKIVNQAWLLAQQGVAIENMSHWAKSVDSGDAKNHEARAAAYYWKNFFLSCTDGFTRGRFDGGANHLLNYGYAVLRAVVARSLVASGLLPTLGIHHHNKYNAYCLADDVMEPYRPFVDRLALQLFGQHDEPDVLAQAQKRQLLQLPTVDVCINAKKSPLMVAVGQTTASLYECFAGQSRKIKYPSFYVPG